MTAPDDAPAGIPAAAKIFLIGLGLCVLFIVVNSYVIPRTRAHRMQSFCSAIAVGESADAVWSHSDSSFEASREPEPTNGDAGSIGNGYLHFQIDVGAFPNLGWDIWNCYVDLDASNRVKRTFLHRER